MSLIGSLEDLSLGDIIQIISLSQKSGVLIVRTDGNEGRVVFRNGAVCGACVKGGPRDTRSIVVGGGFLSESDFDDAEQRAKDHRSSLEVALVDGGWLTRERLESLRRETVEAAVSEIFAWSTGEFSFDVREGHEDEDPPILVPSGMNAQYLAMEAARTSDESTQGFPEMDEPSGELPEDELSAHEMFGVSAGPTDFLSDGPTDFLSSGPPSADPVEGPVEVVEATAPVLDCVLEDSDPFAAQAEVAEVVDVVASAALASVEAESRRSDSDIIAAAFVDEAELTQPIFAKDEAAAPAEETAPTPRPDETQPILPPESVPEPAVVADAAADESAAAPEPAPAPVPDATPVVIVDPDLQALEWTKAALGEHFSRVHIFQRSDFGLDRIRQYLARAVVPCVIVASELPGDPMVGIQDSNDFVRRLKLQAPNMRVLWLGAASTGEDPAPADATLLRPESCVPVQTAPDTAERLCSEVRRVLTPPAAAEAAPDAMQRLRDVTERLRDASSRGEALPLVMDYSAELFERVALFLLNDGVAVSCVMHGEATQEPRGLTLPCDQSALLSAVLEGRRSVRQAPSGAGDALLLAELGGTPEITDSTASVYAAPIESSGRVFAVLYGDQAGSAKPLPDTDSLEVVLQHAGMALDRAALERALHESADA